MIYNKLNKTRRSVGRLCASIRLKYKNKFTIKKSFFSNNHKLPTPKFFGADSMTDMAIKRSTKGHKN